MKRMKFFNNKSSSVVNNSTLGLFIFLITLFISCTPSKKINTEILWDTWGVPHIYGEDVPSVFYAYGSAQMASHGNLLLRMYGEARGKASEYWGEKHIEMDRWLHTLNVPNRAQDWYDQQTPEFQDYLDSFAAGINDYANKNPNLIADSVKVVLPINGVDIMAHTQRTIHVAFSAGSWAPAIARRHLNNGSSAWAVGPTHTEDGNSMLLANPHLAWNGISLLYEAQMTAPGINMYGTSLVGLPVFLIAFNNNLGWTHTVNMTNPFTLYELTLKDEGYIFDGEFRNFEEKIDTIRILTDKGGLRIEEKRTKLSVHGPMIGEKDEKGIALRTVGWNSPGLLNQWWKMGNAENLYEFETALRQQEVPLFTVIYADRDGHIMHHIGGRVPIRSVGNFHDWQSSFKPGDSSQYLWTKIHSYDSLPRVLDPPSGWLQNTNDVPWTTTYPATLKPEKFPLDITGPPMFWARGRRSARLLAEDNHITLDELIKYKHSTRIEFADIIVDDLIKAVKKEGDSLANKAADVLQAWDRSTNSDSKGAILFLQWGREVFQDFNNYYGRRDAPIFAVPWNIEKPFSTPDGLANQKKAVNALKIAAQKVHAKYGALDIPWGDVHRLRGNGLDLPGNGGGDPWGIFRATFYSPAVDNKLVAQGGDSYVAAIEFSTPIKAHVLLTYGNATQPHSLHRFDQLELYARKELRQAWLSKKEVEAHLEFREQISPNYK